MGGHAAKYPGDVDLSSRDFIGLPEDKRIDCRFHHHPPGVPFSPGPNSVGIGGGGGFRWRGAGCYGDSGTRGPPGVGTWCQPRALLHNPIGIGAVHGPRMGLDGSSTASKRPHFESQRDSVTKPRVAALPLPGVVRASTNPTMHPIPASPPVPPRPFPATPPILSPHRNTGPKATETPPPPHPRGAGESPEQGASGTGVRHPSHHDRA